MIKYAIGSFVELLRSLVARLLGGDTGSWTVRPAVADHGFDFDLRVEYEVETEGRPDLYLRVEDDGTGEPFFWMEHVARDRGELVLPVEPDLVPDGNRFSVAVVAGDGTVRPESPVQYVAVPPHPGIGDDGVTP